MKSIHLLPVSTHTEYCNDLREPHFVAPLWHHGVPRKQATVNHSTVPSTMSMGTSVPALAHPNTQARFRVLRTLFATMVAQEGVRLVRTV